MTDNQVHAVLAPSAADRWMGCAGSIAAESFCPKQDDNEFSAEGTAAHELASWALENEVPCAAYVHAVAKNGWVITVDMAEDTQVYVDKIKEYADGNKLFIEQRMSIQHITGEKDAAGTSDAVIITSDMEELQIHDLKYGRGIKVDAPENKQLMMYALAALNQFGMIGDFKRVRLVIHQPRLQHLSEWDISIKDLKAFGSKASDAAATALELVGLAGTGDNRYLQFLTPSEKQCQWCRAKANCPALANFISDTVGAEFLDLTIINDVSTLIPNDSGLLADKMNAISMIEAWCKAIRAEVERCLLQGHEVPGYKLVQGKQGNRRWKDAKVVEELFKKMRLRIQEMYDLSLISPTTADKFFKPYPKRWRKVVEYVTREEGKISVAPASDKRPAIDVKPVDSDFEAIQPGSEFA